MSPLLLVLIAVLVIWLTYKSNKLTNTFEVIFAADSINNACNGVGTEVTAFSSSAEIAADVFLYTTDLGTTPLANGQYGYNGIRFNIAGGEGQIVNLYGCA